jgi:hypothetical protein
MSAAFFLGVVSILVANAIILGACAVTKTPFRSKLGAVFMWRLGYLSNITSVSQERILKKVDTYLNDPAITFALNRIRELLIDKRPWDPDTMPKDPYLKIGKSTKLGYELLFVFLGAFRIFVVRRELVPQISLYVASLAFLGGPSVLLIAP